jgi:hypothetical protein
MDRYQNIKKFVNIKSKKVYYSNLKYPPIPLSLNDIYVITTAGDRLDLLANQYYQDSSLWWIISLANEDLPQNSLYLPLGTQLRIPSNVNSILNSYNELNS